jgi:hypothetical protein
LSASCIDTWFTGSRIDFTSAPGTGGTLTASFTASAPGESGLPLSDDITLDRVAGEGYWTVTAADGLAGGTYTGSFDATGFANIQDGAGLRVVKRANSGFNWALDGAAGVNTGSVVVRTGLSGFSDFAIAGNNQVPVSVSVFSID